MVSVWIHAVSIPHGNPLEKSVDIETTWIHTETTLTKNFSLDEGKKLLMSHKTWEHEIILKPHESKLTNFGTNYCMNPYWNNMNQCWIYAVFILESHWFILKHIIIHNEKFPIYEVDKHLLLKKDFTDNSRPMRNGLSYRLDNFVYI